MKRLNFIVGLVAAAVAIGGRAKAQLPSGSDVNTAIPIYYNQMVNDLGDSGTAPLRVYSITMSKGQQISATLSIGNTAPSARLQVVIWGPTSTTVAFCTYNANCGGYLQYVQGARSASATYTASTSGVYYIEAVFGSQSVNYTLEVTTTGTIPIVPPPTQAGCLTGQVDYVTYSMQLIAAGLPDSASIAGTQMCSTCTTKPPSNPQIVEKLEKAMALNLPVSACYDAGGNIFQITLKHQ
jgi:hypothetical protein